MLETKETREKREGKSEDQKADLNGRISATTASAQGTKSQVTRPAESAPVNRPVELPLFGSEKKKPRSHVLKGYTYQIKTPLGTTFVTINENGGDQPFEVFMHTSKAGSETAAVSEAMGRLISYALRLTSPIEPKERLKEIVRQLEGIGGGRPLGLGPNRVRSLPDGISQVLDEYLVAWDERQHEITANEELTPEKPPKGQMAFTIGDLCPECGQAAVVNEEGCRKCYACGYSEC